MRRMWLRGFTLIELMIVVAIIGILAAISIPKFSRLITKSSEASTKGNLGALRSALTIYYSDMEGYYPVTSLDPLTTNGKYMSSIPPAKLPSTSGQNVGHSDGNAVSGETSPGDHGGWSYNNTYGDANFGRLLVACSHSDSRGNLWTSY